LELIMHFKLHVLRKRKLTLFSWENINFTNRISANVLITHVVSMNTTHVVEIFLQKLFSQSSQLNWLKYANTEKATIDNVFMATHCL